MGFFKGQPTQILLPQVAPITAATEADLAQLLSIVEGGDPQSGHSTSTSTITPADYSTMAKPSVGISGQYVDAGLGGTVRRLTDIGSAVSLDYMYSFSWGNAGGAHCFHITPGGVYQILSTVDGSVYKTGLEFGDLTPTTSGMARECMQWHPTNPDIFYYMLGGTNDATRGIYEHVVSTGVSTRIKNFNQDLQAMGASQNYIDREARYFIVKWGGTFRLWERATDTLYGGTAITTPPDSAWVMISPDGNWVIAHNGAGNKMVQAVNHTAKTIGSATNRWSLGGDHCGVVTDTNGDTWLLTFDGNDSSAWKVRVSDGTSQEMFHPVNEYIDATGVLAGTHKNWGIYSTYKNAGYGGTTAGWQPYFREIVAVNVVTDEVWRFCHHRTRFGNYGNQPKVSCSVDGSFIFWCSDFNDNTPTGYADVYCIPNPFG